jgi:hypothetical protein
MKVESDLQKILEEKFLTPTKFSMAIEKIVFEENINYIEAIVQYCESNNIEIEIVPKLLSKPLKDKIKWDANRLNYIKKVPSKAK